MIQRLALIAATVAALSSTGDRARAGFSITTDLTTSTTPAGLNLGYAANSLTTAPAPTPTGGISFNFLNLNYGGSDFTGAGSITLGGTFDIDNDGVTGTGTFTEVLNYNLSGGFGNLSVASTAITPGPIAGVSFAPILFASPTLSEGNPSLGNLSTVVTASADGGLVPFSAVPEPASLAMVGMGLAGIGLMAHRRRRDG